jgi:hypothetical protein
MITAVGGSSGVGKTTWIREQIAQGQKRVLYFCPSADPMPIDGTWIADQFGDRIEIITPDDTLIYLLLVILKYQDLETRGNIDKSVKSHITGSR